MALFEIVEGWTDRIGPFTLKVNGAAISLTGKTVVPVLRNGRGNAVTLSGAVVIIDAPNGIISYDPAATDFLADHDFPTQYLRWKVTDGSGKVSDFPNGAPDEITVYRP